MKKNLLFVTALMFSVAACKPAPKPAASDAGQVKPDVQIEVGAVEVKAAEPVADAGAPVEATKAPEAKPADEKKPAEKAADAAKDAKAK